MKKKPMKICRCKKCGREFVYVPGFTESQDLCFMCEPRKGWT